MLRKENSKVWFDPQPNFLDLLNLTEPSNSSSNDLNDIQDNLDLWLNVDFGISSNVTNIDNQGISTEEFSSLSRKDLPSAQYVNLLQQTQAEAPLNVLPPILPAPLPISSSELLTPPYVTPHIQSNPNNSFNNNSNDNNNNNNNNNKNNIFWDMNSLNHLSTNLITSQSICDLSTSGSKIITKKDPIKKEIKRPKPENELTPEEMDKRRRNTAASGIYNFLESLNVNQSIYTSDFLTVYLFFSFVKSSSVSR